MVDAIGIESGIITPKKAFSRLRQAVLELLFQFKVLDMSHLPSDFLKSQLG